MLSINGRVTLATVCSLLCMFGILCALSYPDEAGAQVFLPDEEIFTGTLLFICIPTLLVAGFCKMRGLRSVVAAIEVFAIPWSIVVSAMLFVCALISLKTTSSGEQIDIIGGALLAIVFGGSLATFSHFIRKEQTSGTRKTSPLDKIVLSLIVLLSLIFVAQTIRYPLGAHVQFGVWPIFISAIAMVFFNSETTKRLERSVKATVAATLMTAILSVTGWLIAFTNERALGFVLATGLVGLAWGGMILSILGICCEDSEKNTELLWRSAWHNLEIYGLLIMIVFAPVGYIEAILLG